MAGFSIGGLFSGMTDGLKKGLNYDLDFAKLEIKAFSTGNHALQTDLDAVRKAFVQEAADESGVLKGNIVALVLGGGDPFSGSRHMLQAVIAKYGKP